MSDSNRIFSVSHNLKKIEVPSEMETAALMVINTYHGTKYDLGNGPLNDGYHVSKTIKTIGYDVYTLVDASKNQFLEILKKFLSRTTKRLIIYYVGHGVNVRDKNGDEDDGYDEAMFFSDGPLVDDILVKQLDLKNSDSVITLITDACHSGSIWDIQSSGKTGRKLPKGIISVSAAGDKQTAKQTVFEKAEQGVFSYFLRKALIRNPKSTPVEVRNFMRGNLRKYQQNIQIAVTGEELLSVSLV